MHYEISASWPISQPDSDWLRLSYLPHEFERARVLIRKLAAMQGASFVEQPIPAVKMHFHNDNFQNAHGTLVAGEMLPDGAMIMLNGWVTSVPFISIAWGRETNPSDNLFQRIVRHEFVHLLMWKAGMSGWEYSMHGKYQAAHDPFMVELNRLIEDLYPRAHSSWPGLLPL